MTEAAELDRADESYALLVDGEASRARRWGAALGVIATSTYVSASA